MTHRGSMRAVAWLLVVALPAALSPAWSAPAAAKLSGRVLSEDARTPVPGVVIRVGDDSGVEHTSEPTRKDGSFSLESIAPGSYRVTAETPDGVYAVASSLALRAGEARTVQMSLRRGNAGASQGPGGGRVSDEGKVIIGFAILLTVGVLANEISDDGPTSPSAPGDD